MAQKDIQLRIDASIDAAETAKSLGALKRTLIEIQTLQAEIGDESSEEFKKLQKAAEQTSARMAAVRDSIGDIQDKVRTLEGTPVERLTGSFGLLKESILNLDFDKAKIGADGFLNALTPVKDGKLVTGFAGIGGAAASLGGIIKQLASTFIAFGASLLANPIFLLAAAIAAVVAGIVLFLNKMGWLKPMLDAIGKAVDFVIQKFHDLTDWLGITSHAAEKEAEAVRKAEEKKRAAYAVTQNALEGLRDWKIKNIADEDERRKAELEVQRKQAKEEIDLTILKEGLKGNLTKEAYQALQNQKIEIDKFFNKSIKQVDADAAKERAQAAADAAEKRTEKAKEEADKQLKITQDGLNKIKQEQDKLVAGTEEGTQARVDAVKKSLSIQYDYVKTNNNILKVDLDALKKEQDAIILEEENKFKQSEATRLKAKADNLAQIAILEAKSDEERIAAEIEAINIKKENDLANAKLTVEERKLIELQADADIKAIKDKAVDDEKQRQKELLDIRNEAAILEGENRINQIQKELDDETLKKDEKIRLLEELRDAEIALTQEKEAQALASLDAEYQARLKIAKTPEEAAIIDQWYSGERIRITSETEAAVQQTQEQTTQKFIDLKNQELTKSLESAQKGLDFTQKISDLGFAIFKNTRKKETNESDAQRKKRLEEEDKAARIQFAINKGIQLGNAVMSGIQSILAITSVQDFTLGIQTAIRIAAQVALNAMSIAKIASQQYQPAGGGAGAADTGGITAPPVATAPSIAAAPAQQMAQSFQPAQFYQLGQAQPNIGGQQQPIQVVVTETDITKTQTRVRVIEDRATIG